MALGMHGSPNNLWDAIRADGEEASTDAFDMGFGNEAQIFGSAAGAYLLRVQYSQDGKAWYNGETVEPDDDDHFNLKVSGIQARFIRLQALRRPEFAPEDPESTEDEDEPMTLTATLVAKTTR